MNYTIDKPEVCEISDDIVFYICRLLGIEAEELEKNGEFKFTKKAEEIYFTIYDIITNKIEK